MPELTRRTQRPLARHVAAVAAIGLLGIAVYSNTLTASFHFDDRPNILENVLIRMTRLEPSQLRNAALGNRVSSRPVANLSFALNYYFGRYDVAGYHAVNIGVHAVNGVLVYLLAMATFRQFRDVADRRAHRFDDRRIAFLSLFAALFFVAHPLQTQSVTYVVQRMNAMATLFYLLALLLYIGGRRSRLPARRWALWAAAFVSWTLALGSKQIAATLPFVVLLYEWCFFQDPGRDRLKRSARYVLPVVVLTAAVALLYLGDDPWGRITDYGGRDFTMGQRVMTQCRVVILYMSLLLAPLPARLNLSHDTAVSHSLLDPVTTLLGLLLLAALLIAAVCGLRRYRLVGFCILWFLVNQMIESSVLPLEMIYEHRLYLPMVGAALLASCLLGSLTPGPRSHTARSWVVACAVILALAAASYVRNRHWRNDFALWSDVVAKSPRDHRAHNNLGIAWWTSMHRPDEAERHFREALRIKPDYAQAHNSLGNILRSQGRLVVAMAHYRRAIQSSPGFAEAHYNIARALVPQGQLGDAMAHFRLAHRSNPYFAAAHYNLGLVLATLDRVDEAAGHFRRAFAINPALSLTYDKRGSAALLEGRLDKAVNHYRVAVRIRPDDAESHDSLGTALLMRGRHDEAVRHFREALRLNPGLTRTRARLDELLEMKSEESSVDAPAYELPK